MSILKYEGSRPEAAATGPDPNLERVSDLPNGRILC